MRRSWLVFALLLSLGINVGLVGVAWLRLRAQATRAEAPRYFDRDPGARLADHLGLQGETRSRFLSLQRELGGRVREIRPLLSRLERELRRELVSPHPDAARVEALQREIAEATLALDRAFAASVIASREILDDRAKHAYLRFVERFPLRPGLDRERDPRRPPGPRPARPTGGAPPEADERRPPPNSP